MAASSLEGYRPAKLNFNQKAYTTAVDTVQAYLAIIAIQDTCRDKRCGGRRLHTVGISGAVFRELRAVLRLPAAITKHGGRRAAEEQPQGVGQAEPGDAELARLEYDQLALGSHGGQDLVMRRPEGDGHSQAWRVASWMWSKRAVKKLGLSLQAQKAMRVSPGVKGKPNLRRGAEAQGGRGAAPIDIWSLTVDNCTRSLLRLCVLAPLRW